MGIPAFARVASVSLWVLGFAVFASCSGRETQPLAEESPAAQRRPAASDLGAGRFANSADIDAKTGKIKDADKNGVPDRERLYKSKGKEAAKAENSSAGVTLATWVVGARGLLNPNGSVGLQNFLARTMGGFLESVAEAGRTQSKFIKPVYDSKGNLKTVGNLELLKLVWSSGGPKDSLKAKQVADLVSVVLKAQGGREQIEKVVENLNAFTEIFYAVYADPKTKRIPISVIDRYRELVLADYAEVLGKTRLDADRRLELFGEAVESLIVAFGSDAAAKYLGEVSEKLNASSQLSRDQIRVALNGLFGFSKDKPALRNPTSFPFFDGATSAFSGNFNQCMARALDHGAQVGCAQAAMHGLDRALVEWTLTRTPQAVALEGEIDMQAFWRKAFDAVADEEASLGTRLGDREWLLHVIDATVAQYREVLLRKMREGLGTKKGDGAERLDAAVDRFASYISREKLKKLVRDAATAEVPDLMRTSARPELVDFLSQLSKKSTRYPGAPKVQSLVAGVFRGIFLDPEFRAVFVAFAEDIRNVFIDRAAGSINPKGGAPEDKIRREAAIEKLRKELDTNTIVDLVFTRLRQETGLGAGEDLDPLLAFVVLARKSDGAPDRLKADDLVLGVVEDFLRLRQTKVQAVSHVIGAVILGPDGDAILDELVEKETLPAFDAYLEQIGREHGEATRDLLLGLSKAFDSAMVKAHPGSDNIKKYALRLNSRTAFEIISDFAKPLTRALAFQAACDFEKKRPRGCLVEDKKGVLITEGRKEKLFAKEITMLVTLLRAASKAEVTPRRELPGKTVVNGCRDSVSLTLERFPEQVVAGDIHDMREMPLFFLSRVVEEDAGLEPSMLACGQVGVIGQMIRPAFQKKLSLLGLGGETAEVLRDDNLYPLLVEGGSLFDLNQRFRDDISAIFRTTGMAGSSMGDRLESAIYNYGYKAAARAPFEPAAYRPYLRSVLTEPQIRLFDLLDRGSFNSRMRPAQVEELFSKLPKCSALLAQEAVLPYALFARQIVMELFPDPLAAPDKRVADERPDLSVLNEEDGVLILPQPRTDRSYRAAFYPTIREIDGRLGCKKRPPTVNALKLEFKSIGDVASVPTSGDAFLSATGLREAFQKTSVEKVKVLGLEIGGKNAGRLGGIQLGWDQAWGTKLTTSPYYAGNWLLNFRERFFVLRELMRKDPGAIERMEAACEAARRCE
jgi:hypothetical protein